VKQPVAVLTAWIAIVAVAGILSSRLPRVVRGGTDPIAGSASEHVAREVARAFGEGSLSPWLIVLSAPDIGIGDARFAGAAARLTEAIGMLSLVRSVETPWNAPRPELFGRGGHTVIIVVTPRIDADAEAARFKAGLKRAIAAAHVPKTFRVELTGSSAAIRAMDEASAADLWAVERIGVPLTLVILLLVFGAPLAALIPVVLALIAVSIGFGGLYALHGWTPVSVFAETVVWMIGLGVGVDYALFVVSRYREELRRGLTPEQAAEAAAGTAGKSVMYSGATVAIGFLALFLVRAPFLHTIAIGGVLVVAAAVAASLTLLPAVLVRLGPRLMWPRKPQTISAGAVRRNPFWPAWVGGVMKRPWLALIVCGVVLAVFLVPVTRLRSWNIGAAQLPQEDEARHGYETLAQEFPRGWMAPIVVMVEAPVGHAVWEPKQREAIGELAVRLGRDPGSGMVLGAHQMLGLLDTPGIRELADRSPEHPLDAMPGPVRSAAARVVSADGRIAILKLMTPGPPEDRTTIAYLRRLRAQNWPEMDGAGLTASVGGYAGVLADFDAELFGRLPWVVLAVLLVTFGVLAALFKSVVLPLKATILNLVSVLAAYGFLVLVFQEGRLADWIGLDPPGGLNACIVVMLLTILFGLSMDYEVFLLSRVREEHRASGDDARAVAIGLGETAGIITSAALVMISIFAAFGFTRLVPTREFGLGLAFAVALDASIIRVMLVPALMAISGRRNWWWPGGKAGN
jgi:RND superfamily putative drug exporter